MDVREKLVELLNKANSACVGTDCFEGCKFYMENDCLYKLMADVMIENGVTVQEWISVEDRLPEKNTSVVTATDNGIVFQCLYAYDGWDLWEGNNVNITHWQPMPQPPKGE